MWSSLRGARPDIVVDDGARGVAAVNLIEGIARGVSCAGDTARCWRKLWNIKIVK